MDLLKLFCDVDDFCNEFEPQWEQQLLDKSEKKRKRKSRLSLSEIMSITIAFHSSCYRTFKDYYTKHVLKYQHCNFPGLVSYNRFVELMPTALIPLCAYLNTRKGKVSGIAFVDSTSIVTSFLFITFAFYPFQ